MAKRKTARESLDPEARDILEGGRSEPTRPTRPQPMVSLACRIPAELLDRLNLACFERKRSGAVPFSKQDAVAAGIDLWLKKVGY